MRREWLAEGILRENQWEYYKRRKGQEAKEVATRFCGVITKVRMYYL